MSNWNHDITQAPRDGNILLFVHGIYVVAYYEDKYYQAWVGGHSYWDDKDIDGWMFIEPFTFKSDEPNS